MMNYAWGKYFTFITRLTNVAFTSDGSRLIFVSKTNYIFIMKSSDGSIVNVRTYTTYTNYINDYTMRRVLISSTTNGFAIISFTV